MAEMTPSRKRLAMLIVVVGSALIGERVVALRGGDGEVAEPVAASPDRTRARPTSIASKEAPDASATAVQLGRLDDRQRALADGSGATGALQPTLFDAVSWRPSTPTPTSVAPPLPPTPVAPPFPYAYLGGLSEDGVRTAFFTQGERVLPVKAGDTVDAVYRIDQMTEKHMTLTYLPLNQSQTLALGSAR